MRLIQTLVSNVGGFKVMSQAKQTLVTLGKVQDGVLYLTLEYPMSQHLQEVYNEMLAVEAPDYCIVQTRYAGAAKVSELVSSTGRVDATLVLNQWVATSALASSNRSKTMKPTSVVNSLVDFAFSKMHEPSITTNFFRTMEDKPLVLIFYAQEENQPRVYHAFWTEDGNSHGHVVLGVAEARDRFVRNCYERDSVTVVPSAAYDSLTAQNHEDARYLAIQMLKEWE